MPIIKINKRKVRNLRLLEKSKEKRDDRTRFSRHAGRTKIDPNAQEEPTLMLVENCNGISGGDNVPSFKL
jgi:hypothetical protein